MNETYKQEIKNISREKLIKHAINSLTSNRMDSYLVSKEHLEKITEHFNSMLFNTREWHDLDVETKNSYNWLFFGGKSSWMEFYDTICKPKTVNELKVLYLSGPEPNNDIDVLCSNGIRLENIWAIESDKSTYDKAVNSLIESGVQIKIHRGSLAEFFELTNHEFDIIYFDACSSLLSPQQSPLETLKQIFLNKRLSGLSALITNFAAPQNNYEWDKILASWFCTKYLEVPEVESECDIDFYLQSYCIPEYSKFIASHLENYYDKFLTHFIPILASEIIPIWQLTSINSIQNNYFLNESLLFKKLEFIRDYKIQNITVQNLATEIQHYLLAIDSYPLLNWARILRETFPKDHVLNKFIDSNRRKMSIEDALYIGSLLKRFEEGATELKTFIYDICGDKLKETLKNLDFFDRNMHIACDIPMKNLFVELLVGLYGHPYIAHAGKSLSLKYKAKETWMYSDVFIFDQCRYLYDFLPTLDLWQSFFQNWTKQVIVRGCIDGIRRNHLHLNTELFKWGFIEGVYGNEFGQANLADRINLNEKPD